MKTIALRFGEHFAPECGTIAAHQLVIDKLGYVWYGKMGANISTKVKNEIMKSDKPKILLIRSGKTERYWAYISEISTVTPSKEEIPEYYRDNTNSFKTWFKVFRFDIAAKGVLSKYVVASSQIPVGEVSKHSMSPYYIIEGSETDELGK